jgi:predicted ester cyclase
MATAEAPVGVSNGELVRWGFSKINEKDVEPLRDFWTLETHERFPDRTLTGSDEIVPYFEEIFAAISGFHIEIKALVEQGDDVFVRWQLTGRHTGPFGGIAGTGREVAVDGVDHFVIRDGRVISNFVIFDRMQTAQQMGLMPPDDSRQDRAMKAAFNAKTKIAAKLRR